MNFRRTKGIFLKNWYLSLHFERFLDITFWPALDVLLWAFVALYLQQVNQSMNFYSVLLGAVFLWMLFIRSSNDLAVYVLEDFYKRSLHNLFISPIEEQDLFTGILSFAMMRVFFTTVFLMLFSVVLLHFNIFSIDWIMITALYVPIVICGWGLAFFLSGIFFRYGQEVNVLAWAIPWVFQPFSCVFYPLASLPLWMQRISVFIPMTHIFEGFRGVIAHQDVTSQIVMAYAGSIAFFFIGLWFFFWSIRRSKRTGRLARS